ncbi:MAG: hypothetical protein ACOCQ4_00105 [bacterium]
MMNDYEIFLNKLKQSHDEEKKKLYQRLQKISKGDTLDTQHFYKNWLSKIEAFKYNVPCGLENDYDYDLLLRLISMSLSSDYIIYYPQTYDDFYTEENLLPEVKIMVESKGYKAGGAISEIEDYQIERFFEIYFEETINYEVIMKNDEMSKIHFDAEKTLRLIDYKKKTFKMEMQYKRLIATI